VVEAHTRDPSNPWAIGHGLVAEGQNMPLSNGQPAVEWLFSSYAERIKVGQSWALVFPEARGSTRIEPHPDLLLKALTDAGIPPNHPVTVMGHSHTVSDLYTGVLAETFYDPKTKQGNFKSENDIPWTLFGVASWSKPDLVWTNAAGHTTSFDALTDYAAEHLTTVTQFIAESQSNGKPFQKRGQGIFAFSCGGAHMIQGVIHARIRGFGSASDDGPFEEQLNRLVYRYPIELKQIDAGRVSHPEFKVPLLVQRLKLTGHTLETMARIAASGAPKAPTGTELTAYARDLAESVQLLEKSEVFKNLNTLRTKNEQLYLDVVGDSAHALRGLRIATGQATVVY